MLRTWVLTVFTETDSSLAISGLDRLVGRYRSTLSSLGLSSSVGGDEGWSLAAGEAPCRTSRISASRAACAVSCRGRASSSSPAPVIANGRTSRSGSARARARSAAWFAARWSPSARWASPASRCVSTSVTSPMTGAVPLRTSASALRAPAGSPSVRQITARALLISPELARSSSSAARRAWAWASIPRRAWGVSGQPVPWFDRAELPQRLAVVAAAGVEPPGRQVQQLPDARPGVGLQGLCGALQPSLAFVKLTRPDRRGGERYQRGRDDRLCAPAVSLGEFDRLLAALPGGGERADPRRESELRQAGDFEVGPADPPGQDGALLEVTFSVWRPQRPRLEGPQVHQRHCAQVAVEGDVVVGLPG